MIEAEDEKWLKWVLTECFPHTGYGLKEKGELLGFRILIEQLLKNLEAEVNAIRALSKERANAKKMKERLDILATHLFYLRRFCQDKIKQKQKDEGGSDV